MVGLRITDVYQFCDLASKFYAPTDIRCIIQFTHKNPDPVNTTDGKGNDIPVHAMKARRGSGRTAPLGHNLGTGWI